jgi:hypothetical protein
MLDAIPITEYHKFQIIYWPLGGSLSDPKQAIVPEIAQELQVIWDLAAPVDSEVLDIDLIIKTQNHAKELRKAYDEFHSHVQDLGIEKGLKSFREAIGPITEEYNKSAPFLDLVDKVLLGSITICAASLTSAGIFSLFGPQITGLVPSGAAFVSEWGILKSEIARQWIRGKYAKLLGTIGIGPFRFTHTWRAHRIVDKSRLGDIEQ